MKVKISRKEHNLMFKYRQCKFLTFYEIIDDPKNKDIEMYQKIRLISKILFTLVSPVLVLWFGFPSVFKSVKESWVVSNVGADTVSREWFYKRLKEIRDDH